MKFSPYDPVHVLLKLIQEIYSKYMLIQVDVDALRQRNIDLQDLLEKQKAKHDKDLEAMHEEIRGLQKQVREQ